MTSTRCCSAAPNWLPRPRSARPPSSTRPTSCAPGSARARPADRAARLDAADQQRFGAGVEGAPRHRAVAGIHALLDHGWTPEGILAALASGDLDGVRSGAAVLEHRARRLLDRAGLDATLQEMPAPKTPHEEWHRASRLLFAAETRHLATRPTGDLAAEHRDVTRMLTANVTERAAQQLDSRHHVITNRQGVDARCSVPDAATALDNRLRLLDAALAHQIDEAAARLAQEPAPYLVALLGHRPAESTAASDWNRRAQAVEHYRHHVLGLPYGIPACSSGGTPSELALGTPPTEPAQRILYERLLARRATLDLDMTG